ncbi:MAG TPA: thiosulfohydrolase SoxB [Burkholderiales bacterium]|nr:thiosulfohydrolase SoxB [Burkholderiales bacterium]
MSRREFLQALAAAAAAGLPLGSWAAGDEKFYDLPRFGNVSLLHFTDCHAQLLPVYFREPSANIGVAGSMNRPPHVVGEPLLRLFKIRPGSREAYAFSHLDFAAAARRYGRLGGFAHLATLVKRLRAERRASLLLDGGDTWQGSATSLWTRGRDMIEAQKLLGVEIMTGHWEFTYGADRVKEVIEKDFAGRIEFLAQNVETGDFGDPVFKPYTIRSVGGVPVAVIGQAFPYTPIAHPRRFVADWRFGIAEKRLQGIVEEARGKGAAVVVLLSHNGMDVDIKLASRVTGIDAILGGHTHDAVPVPIPVRNRRGKTLVTNAGSNGKFLAVLDLEVRDGKVSGYRYRLLPVFASLLQPDPEMARLIEAQRAPYADRLSEELARTDTLLYRRGNFNGSFDQLILDALMEAKGAEIAFSPGFRWGTSLLPGEAITLEQVMNLTAITYPETVVSELTGSAIKAFMEDVCDNLFHPDPYYQQGGDMVRVGGLSYSCAPGNRIGARIGDLRLRGRPIDAGKTYKVASWAPVAEGASGEPVWEVLSRYLRDRKTVTLRKLELPRLIGMAGNLGVAPSGP